MKTTLAFVFLCACLAGSADAELLQRFHVLNFTMTTDTPRPRVGVPFHVAVTIKVRERIDQLQYFNLPAFSGLQTLGDRRVVIYTRDGGSVYRETLTLVSRQAGPTAIGSASLDAVDLRDSRTKRFTSNDLILNVIGKTPPLAPTALRALLAVLALLLIAAAAIAIAAIAGRQRRVTQGVQSAPAVDNDLVPTPPFGLDEALADLRAQRDRPSVLRVRQALWSIAGARQGETLHDVLQRAAASADGLRGMLVVIERAAFVHDTGLQQAIDAALSQREHSIVR
jgi:hypothetical protein